MSAEVFCTSETFSVACTTSQVVIVRRAIYGRLDAGRCITSEYAHAMGCYADVTVYLQDVCSGRQNCSLLVATIDAIAQPCGKDFKSYLEMSYECATGQSIGYIIIIYTAGFRLSYAYRYPRNMLQNNLFFKC